MLLYTPIPMEIVLEGLDKERTYREVQIDGITMIVERINDSESKIIKLISTNPSDFLNPAFQPGKILSYEVHFASDSCL